MGGRARLSSLLEPLADLDALDGLDAHDRLRQHAVDLAVPVDVAAEAERHPEGQHLGDAAEGVAGLGRRLDGRDHRSRRRPVEAPDLVVVDGRKVVDARPTLGRGPDIAQLQGVAEHRGAELSEEGLGQRTRRHACGGLASRRALEHVTGVVEAVLLHADEVGVAGPRGREDLGGRPGCGGHLLAPALPLGVLDLDRHR